MFVTLSESCSKICYVVLMESVFHANHGLHELRNQNQHEKLKHEKLFSLDKNGFKNFKNDITVIFFYCTVSKNQTRISVNAK